MYFEAVFCFYVLLNHLISNSFFRLVSFSSLGDIIKRYFTLSLVKLHFYVDYAIGFLWESITTVSTCTVIGNISTPHASTAWYPSFLKQAKSLASVSGPQET